MELRPYQFDAATRVEASLDLHGRVVLQLPTGGGKTAIGTKLIPPTGVVWLLCHRREILRQTSAALTAAGVEHAIAAAGKRGDQSKRVQLCSIGSMLNRMRTYPA